MIRIHNSKGLQQQIEIGSHQLLGDVSTELGGDGAGPTHTICSTPRSAPARP